MGASRQPTKNPPRGPYPVPLNRARLLGTTIGYFQRLLGEDMGATRGYQPLVAVWAEQQIVVADEFRDGNVAGGEDPLTWVKRAFANLPSWVLERRLRADSASYYTPLLKYFVAEKVGFAISADKLIHISVHLVADTP